jgi:hypothetical protein
MYKITAVLLILFLSIGKLSAQVVGGLALKDPTQPPAAPQSGQIKPEIMQEKPKPIHVQMISYQQNGTSFVVINGNRFIEGDVFDEAIIQKIEKNKVILSNPERKPLMLEYARLSVKKNEEGAP